jgi:thioredoxin reductase
MHTHDHPDTTCDAIVVGGGPAGLQAALTLARVHRRVLLLDSGRYRNDPAAHMHNVLAHDGTPPADFRTLAREQVAAYPTATIREDTVTSVRPEGQGYAVTLDDPEGTVLTARGLVLATGVRDVLPEVPGLAALWGDRVVHCPFCHGHEFADRPVAVLGTVPAGHLPAILAPVVSHTTVLTDGQPPVPTAAAATRTERVTGLHRTDDGVRVTFADGPDLEVAGVYVSTTLEQAAPFAAQLGLTTLPSGCVEVDAMGRTSLPRVHAAGDMAHVAALPMPMSSVISAAASGAMAAGSLVAALL